MRLLRYLNCPAVAHCQGAQRKDAWPIVLWRVKTRQMLQLSYIKQLTNAVPFRSGCWNPDSIVHLCKIICGYPKPTHWFEVYEREHGTWRKLLCVMRKGRHPAIHSLGIEDQTIVLIIFWHCKQSNSFIPVNFIQPKNSTCPLRIPFACKTQKLLFRTMHSTPRLFRPHVRGQSNSSGINKRIFNYGINQVRSGIKIGAMFPLDSAGNDRLRNRLWHTRHTKRTPCIRGTTRGRTKWIKITTGGHIMLIHGSGLGRIWVQFTCKVKN